MFALHVYLLTCLFVLSNAMNLVDLLSKLRRGNPVGPPTNVYDRTASVNTVSFGVPAGYNDAAFQSHLIQPVQPSELKSNFHNLMRQIGPSGLTGRSQTNTRTNGQSRQHYTQVQRRPWTPRQQSSNRQQYSTVQQIPQRQQIHGGGWISPISNQNPSSSRHQFYQGFTQTQGTVANRARVTQTPRFPREQLPVSNFGRAHVPQQTAFTRDQGLRPNQSSAQSPRTTGFIQEQGSLFNNGRRQVARQNGFTRKHTATSSPRRVQNGFKQNKIPQSNHGAMRQFGSQTNTQMSSGTNFGRMPTNARYTVPDVRHRQF